MAMPEPVNKPTRLRVQRLPKRRGLKVHSFVIDQPHSPDHRRRRKLDVTASPIGALFDLNPYQTILGLYAEKTGVLLKDEDTLAMRRGRLLEDAVARAYQEKHPSYKITKARRYYRAPDIRLGATPDFVMIDDQGRRANLQTKTVAPHVFKRYWTDETAPTWIVLQCLTEAMLLHADYGVIAVLIVDGYRFDLHEYIVPRHEAAERRIIESVQKFWADIEAGRVPESQAGDRALLGVMYPQETPGLTVDLRGDNELPGLLRRRERYKHLIELMTEKKNDIETNLIAKMGLAEIALVNDWRISLRHVHRKEHTVRASDFRQLRIARDRDKDGEKVA
jgi:predicted phage-related endonuclease